MNSVENVARKKIDHLQIKNAQLMEEVIALKNELATLKGSPQAEAMKAVALKKLATLKGCPKAEAMKEEVAFKKLATRKENRKSEAPKQLGTLNKGPQSEAMKEQALKPVNASYLFIEKTKMPPTEKYLYVTEKHPEVTKSMEKGHMTEIAKMKKAHIAKISKKLTDMWLELDPPPKRNTRK